MNKRKTKWQETEFILSMFADRKSIAREKEQGRPQNQIALIERQETIGKSKGLLEDCEILFGEEAESKIREYFILKGRREKMEKRMEKIMRKTKIIATVGPACNNIETLETLISNGVDIFRLNMSHGSHESHRDNIALIRSVELSLDKPLCIIGDLQGPEIRTGKLKDKEVYLNSGLLIKLTPSECEGDTKQIHITHEKLSQDVAPGQLVYMSDGAITLNVEKISGKDVYCRVQRGGLLGERKGLNFPGANLSLSFLIDKDYDDIQFLINEDVDYIAASFVRTSEDLIMMRGYMDGRKGENINIIAKIETQQAVNNLNNIVRHCNGIMVARGDLGVEIPIEEVPLVQKEIIEVANNRGIPVITATQMLDSMTWNAYPTRAEVTDVANAIIDGTDAIMLSGETAMGEYPALTVETMHKLALHAETTGKIKLKMEPSEQGVSRAVATAACLVANQIDAAAIITITTSGSTACRIARNRPQQIIIACSSDIKVVRQLLLVWNIRPMKMEQMVSTEQIHEDGKKIAKEMGFVKKGDVTVIVSGIPVGVAGTTNSIIAEKVG